MYFCGVQSRNKRKKDICDRYAALNKSKAPRGLKKWQNKLALKANKKLNVNHIKCSRCDSSTCIACITSICNAMENNNEHHGDLWYKHVKNRLSTNPKLSKFIGHCCELKSAIENCAINKETRSPSDKDDGLLYDGYLHIPELGILIQPSIAKSVDVHGLGKENSIDVPGLLHGVVNEMNAKEFYKNKVLPDASECNEINTETKVVEYIDLFGNAKRIECLIQTYCVLNLCATSKIQHDDVTENDIRHSKVLRGPHDNKVWIILGRTSASSQSCHLVNMRWPTTLTDEISIDTRILYHDTMQLLKHNGLEAIRKGGSNGKTTYSNGKILSLLNTNTAFVRKGRAVKVVKLQNVWSCYYLASGGSKKSEYVTERIIKC